MKRIKITLLLLVTMIFLVACSLNIEDATETSGNNKIEVKNIKFEDDIFTADVYINN